MPAADRPDSGRRPRPTPIAASLFSVLCALVGGVLGGVASGAMHVNPVLGLLLPIGGATVFGLVGFIAGKPIDRRGYPENGGWRGVLVCLGAVVGMASGLLLGGWILTRPRPGLPVLPLPLVLLPVAFLFLGAVLGARVGEAFDRLHGGSDDVEKAGGRDSDAS